MLKISLIDSARQRRPVIEENLIAPWAAEKRFAKKQGQTFAAVSSLSR
jgi:hypothetical protein